MFSVEQWSFSVIKFWISQIFKTTGPILIHFLPYTISLLIHTRLVFLDQPFSFLRNSSPSIWERTVYIRGLIFHFSTSVKLIFNLWPLIYFRKGFNSWKFVKSNRNWPCSSTDLCSNHIQHQLRFVQELPFLIILSHESLAAKFIIKLVTFNYEH